ncbi:hypothetical protein GOM49_08590 [Clostridium bovifaecis]|uniref:Uncharacterized protein n=1 Tax=Clostridium bovifaecis TaxID=2184719 RepID=A0A6I6ENA2_9CLOT|nr:hypothetical protein GOM49_08590 [Clostridium bovifaecis]
MMKRNYRHDYIVIIMFVIILVINTLNFITYRKILSQRDKLEKIPYINVEKIQPNSIQYSSIIKDIEGREYIKIEKIVNNMDNNIVNMKLQFKGELYLLDGFIENIKIKIVYIA